MKNLLKLYLVLIVFIFGCNGRNDKNSNGEIRKGGTLNIALVNDIDSFNPVVSTDIVSGAVQDIIFPALVSMNWNDSLGYSDYEPLLASSWSELPETYSIIFNLRNDVFWSDGRKVGFEDILYSYKLYSNPASASPQQFLFEGFYKNEKSEVDFGRSLKKLNDSSFMVIYTRKIQNPLQLAILKIVPDNYYGSDFRKLRENSNSMNPLSAGPYLLEKWEMNQRIVLSGNNNYILGSKANIDKIIFKILPDYTTRLTGLKTGEIDFMEGIKPEDVSGLKKSYPDIETISLSGRNYEFVCWSNIDHKLYRKDGQIKPHPLFGKKEIRTALALAIDREELIEGSLQGLGEVCNGPISPIFKWAFNDDLKPLAYDPGKALQILESEGWYDSNRNGILDRQGREFSFSLFINSGSPRREFAANMIKNYLHKIGIEVKIEKLEWNLFETKIINRELDAFINGMAVSSDINPYEFWYSDLNKASMNDAGYQNKQVDRLIETANNLDRKLSAPYWKEFQRMIFDDQPCAFLYWYPNIIGYNKRVKNVKSNIWDSYNQISNWWLSN